MMCETAVFSKRKYERSWTSANLHIDVFKSQLLRTYTTSQPNGQQIRHLFTYRLVVERSSLGVLLREKTR